MPISIPISSRPLPKQRETLVNRLHPRSIAKSLLDRAVRWRVPVVQPQIIRSLPHDTDAFTQGLIYHEGYLYESTGLVGRSSLRRLDSRDGKLMQLIPIPAEFAEGIAILHDRLYQLSLYSGKSRIFKFPELTLIGEVRYRGQGWGLASRADFLLVSDGTSSLRLFNQHFRVLRTLRVHSNFMPVRKLNDLECARGLIYANIWKTTDLFEISPDTGRLMRIIDCSDLAPARSDLEAVMNGVAFNPEEQTFFITGKCWSQIFEVTIPQ